MGLFSKRFSVDSLKDAAASAKAKLDAGASSLKDTASDLSAKTIEFTESASKAISSFDYDNAKLKSLSTASELGAGAKEIAEKVIDSVRDFDYEEAQQNAHTKALQLGESVIELKDKAVVAARNFDTDEVKASAGNFSKDSATKLKQYFCKTFEVDKSTFDMVQDIRNRLPTPAKSMDDIYDQCREEAIRRAIAAFMLGNILDEKSQAKYDKLTDDFSDYRKTRAKFMGDEHANYSGMKPGVETENGTDFKNAYNPDEPLIYEQIKGTAVTVDHVTSRKEIFADTLLKIGLTDKQLGDVVNDPRNLVYMHRSLNSQKGEMDAYDWLSQNSRPHPTDAGKLIVTIQRSNVEHVIDKKAVDEAYAESKQAIRDGQIQAVKEISSTVALTGATMAAQQVVGLIVVETIDVFMDELKRVKLISSDGMIEELKASKERISEALSKRFDERRIWERAKTLGIEAGVAGALSVIPQILISLILKMPAFVYAIIREGTLSVVRCVRVLSSNDPDKLASLQVIMLGTASAVAGVYVQRVISQGIAAVPLLNKFNTQVSGILSGLMITAIPLAAIYTFEQNKKLMMLRIQVCTGVSRE
jgi:hypothetical protein